MQLQLGKLARVDQAVIRSLRLVIGLLKFTSNTRLLYQLESRAKIVQQRVPVVSINVVHQVHQLHVFDAVIAKELAHMRVVLLLDVSIVILFVRPPSYEFYVPVFIVLKVARQRPVDEFCAVIRGETDHAKG